MIKASFVNLVDRVFSCDINLWRSQRITLNGLCGLIHSVYSQIRKNVAEHYPHGCAGLLLNNFIGGHRLKNSAFRSQKERNREGARANFGKIMSNFWEDELPESR